DGHYPDRFVVVADGLPPDQRSYEWVVPNPGYATTNQPQFIRVIAVDAAGQEGWDQMPLVVPSDRIQGELTITTNLSGMTFYSGQPIPTMDWTGSVSGFPGIEPHIVLEADGTTIEGIAIDGRGMFFPTFPEISTDTARLAIRARNTSNDVKWFFAPGYFSIRHDPRLNLVPPSVQIITPTEGASYDSGTVVPISWSASDDEALHSFDIQASYDNGRTWHLIARDLPASARSYNWVLPPNGSIPKVLVRVIARDIRFQNNSSRTNQGFSIGGESVIALSALSLNPPSTTGGSSSLGTVTLSAPAPPGGAVVPLFSSNPSVATVPANVTVPTGANSVSFAVATGAVTAQSSATISATYGGETRATTLTVFPLPRLSSLTLNPATVVSGHSSQGIVALSNPAPAGGIIVSLTSSNTGVAGTPASVTIAAGSTSASFTVTTMTVGSSTTVTISAACGGLSQSRTLTVTPPVVTDAVSITLAEYTAAQKRLRVRATSTSGTATLKAYVTADSTLIGTLSNLGKGIYEGLFLWPVNPRNITVISGNGGSATRQVVLR
ncbi:MAG TPA: hypothetical protein VLG74_10815, partial [Blastocatellia bacterium]|nr:hypothetical protein [Blastocatellia bacterium]